MRETVRSLSNVSIFTHFASVLLRNFDENTPAGNKEEIAFSFIF